MSDLFSEEFLAKVITGDQEGTCIVNSHLEGDSWSVAKTVVFSFEDKFYKFSFDNESWEDDGYIVIVASLKEVHPTTKTVTVYE